MTPEQARFREALEGFWTTLADAVEPMTGPVARFLSRLLS